MEEQNSDRPQPRAMGAGLAPAKPRKAPGRIVLVNITSPTLDAGALKPVLRPAMIVEPWGDDVTYANLCLFPDGENDRLRLQELGWLPVQDNPPPVPMGMWRTSIHEGMARGEWRWPDRV